jgi:hypothetical protein
MNFADARKQAEAQGLIGGGDYYKLKEGQNRIRLMSECLPHAGEFKGTRNFKWLCYVLDRRDGKVKPFFMPHTIYKALEAYQLSEDFAFVDVPMPYDITVNADGAGTKEVKYTVMPGKVKPLAREDEQALADQKPLAELQKKLKEKAAKEPEPPRDEEHDFNPADFDGEYDGGRR